MDAKPLLVFPKWSNKVALAVIVSLLLAPTYIVTLVAYGLNPTTLNVGYQPVQPVPYSHKLHAGELGMDCRYCHNTVEKSAFAAIPPTDTCINCHWSLFNVKPEEKDKSKRSKALEPVFVSAETGKPVPWVKVNDLPNYVFFNHSAHVNVGMSCVECHGNVNHMEVVSQEKPLNMGWCLECHRDPAARIRPKEQVTNLDWKPGPEDKTVVGVFAKLPDLQKRAADVLVEPGDDLAKRYVAKLAADNPKRLQREMGVELIKLYHVQPNTDCVTCHR
jgi:hypothetical protein